MHTNTRKTANTNTEKHAKRRKKNARKAGHMTRHTRTASQRSAQPMVQPPDSLHGSRTSERRVGNKGEGGPGTVSYTHLRAHETEADL
eukprot:1757249-Rhodomonas_salina.1